MTVREAIRLIEADGWYLVATRGSHRQFKHRTKPGRVTIAGKPSDDLAPGTRKSIFKQAGLKENALMRYVAVVIEEGGGQFTRRMSLTWTPVASPLEITVSSLRSRNP